MDDVTLAAHLLAARVRYELVDVGSSTRTAEEAAEALGVPAAMVVKSLVCVADDLPVLALVPGDRVLTLAKLRAATGATDVALARGKSVKASTGYPIGAVAPLGHPAPLPTYADRTLRALDAAYFGGGSHRHMLRMAIADLARLTGLEWADLTGTEALVAPGSEAVPREANPGRSP